MRPRLLDLFCGAGGAAMGYHRAGFEVVGVDNEAHIDYPFEFIQADALDLLADTAFLATFDSVHASPPCPRYSTLSVVRGNRADHPDLVPPVTAALRSWGGAYVVENVPGAPLHNPLILCGSEFGLGADCRDGVWRQLRRHRWFESNAPMLRPGGCAHRGEPVGVYGHGGSGSSRTRGSRRGYQATKAEALAALGVPWMTRMQAISNAIPPAYTELIGAQILAHLRAEAAA